MGDNRLRYLERINENVLKVNIGMQPNMKVPGKIFVNQPLYDILVEELQHPSSFLPSVVQVANVASLPGIVGYSLGMPDIHSGYGFAIGNVAAFDLEDSQSVVSPGGVGFDINCGVRLIRTNLTVDDINGKLDTIATEMYNSIPVGVGSEGGLSLSRPDLEQILLTGVDWTVSKGWAWPEDKEHTEEKGRLMTADPSKVSSRARARGISQLASLGAGNHYCEIQAIDEIYDEDAASVMGLRKKGQICIMVHTGSRGMGHQIATDYLQVMDRVIWKEKMHLNDRQLACTRINSQEGQDYLAAMACGANFAWANRQGITYNVRKSFEKVMGMSAQAMDMNLIYDTSHNVAKVEEHQVDGFTRKLLVHRKGSTRAFGPGHPQIPSDYQQIGQPVLIGGSMGTHSYVLTGTQTGMEQTFGSTCHGAGRQLSRASSRRNLSPTEVIEDMRKKGIILKVLSPELVMEEAPGSYKDVDCVVATCHDAGISKKCVKMRPLAVIKG